MPVKHRVRRRRQRGAGLLDWLKRASGFLRKTKLISTIGSTLGQAGVPLAGSIGNAARAVGYGRKSRRGAGIRLAGGRRLR